MKLELDLGNPSYTLLHRAGLAGLYMTVNQLKKEGVKPSPELQIEWILTEKHLTHRQVILEWQGQDFQFLNWLLKESFRISNEDLIELRGLNSKTMRIDAQVIVHLGMLGTFLQHTSTHKSLGTQTKPFELEPDTKPLQVTYKALSSYVHQEFAKNLCDAKGNLLKTPISVAGWLNPGAVVRHIAFSSSTSFEELPEDALVLLFAPVACYYFLLRSKLRDKRSQYALIIPEVTNLEKYAGYRTVNLRGVTYKDFFASGLGDAGLRFLTYEETTEIAEAFELERCQVLTLGTVAWASQQKTRTDLYLVDISTSPKVANNYRLCKQEFSDRLMASKDGDGSFIASSFAREFICENLVRQREWYTGLSDVITSNELFEKLLYERGGLYTMVKKATYDERDKLFVEACHEGIKYTYGKINKYAKKGEDLTARFDRVTIRLRADLNRCKSAESFREFITDFWARAGRLPTLQKNWHELMLLINSPKDWKKCRDLTLLALASYRKDEKNTNTNLDESEDSLEVGDEESNDSGIPLVEEW